MKKILFALMALVFIGCGEKRGGFVFAAKSCVIDTVYEQQRSTIEFDRKYWVVTDCGKFSVMSGFRLNKGDTVVLSVIKNVEK